MDTQALPADPPPVRLKQVWLVMTETVLTIDVYVSPLRPYAGSPAQGPGDDPNWSPMSSALIAGEEEAILVDALIANEQVDALAEWVRVANERDSVEGIVEGMLALHGDRENPHTLWISARGE